MHSVIVPRQKSDKLSCLPHSALTDLTAAVCTAAFTIHLHSLLRLEGWDVVEQAWMLQP